MPRRRGNVEVDALGGDDFSLMDVPRDTVAERGASVALRLDAEPEPLKGAGMTISTRRSFRGTASAREAGRSRSSSSST